MNKKLLYALLLVVVGSLSYVLIRYNRRTAFADRTELTSVSVQSVVKPHSIDELKKVLENSDKPVSISGARYSQGGQTAYPDGIVIDMSSLDRIIALDVENKRITVEAGATWRQIQEYIDPYNLSIKVMQSYNDFSVGGSLGVNVHARDMNYGSLISSVESILVLLANGSLVQADRTKNQDLFRAAIGGYGLLGVIVSATLSLTDNVHLERSVRGIAIKDYPNLFYRLSYDTSVVFQNADVFPMDFSKALSVTWRRTTKPVTEKQRLQSGVVKHLPKRALEVLIRRLPILRRVRPLMESAKGLSKAVVWRNYEMSYSVKQLAMQLHFPTTMTLQEYFVPVERFHEAMTVFREILNAYSVNVLNFSVRHVPKDTEVVLSYARRESFAFVLYINVLNTGEGKEYLCSWTRALIDEITQLGGTYYLPYVLCAKKEQFRKAYPTYQEFKELKDTYDPKHRFRNMLWKTYFE